MTDLLFSIGNAAATAGIVSSLPTALPSEGPDFNAILRRIAGGMDNSGSPQPTSDSLIPTSDLADTTHRTSALPATVATTLIAGGTEKIAALLQRLAGGMQNDGPMPGDEKIYTLLAEIAATWREPDKGIAAGMPDIPEQDPTAELPLAGSESDLEQLHNVLSALVASFFFPPDPSTPSEGAEESTPVEAEPVEPDAKSGKVPQIPLYNADALPIPEIGDAHTVDRAVARAGGHSTETPVVENGLIPDQPAGVAKPDRADHGADSTIRPAHTTASRQPGYSGPVQDAQPVDYPQDAQPAENQGAKIQGRNAVPVSRTDTVHNHTHSNPTDSKPTDQSAAKPRADGTPAPVHIPRQEPLAFKVELPGLGTAAVRLRPVEGAFRAEIVLPDTAHVPVAEILPALVERLSAAGQAQVIADIEVANVAEEVVEEMEQVAVPATLQAEPVLSDTPSAVAVDGGAEQPHGVPAQQPHGVPAQKGRSVESAPTLIVQTGPVSEPSASTPEPRLNRRYTQTSLPVEPAIVPEASSSPDSPVPAQTPVAKAGTGRIVPLPAGIAAQADITSLVFYVPTGGARTAMNANPVEPGSAIAGPAVDSAVFSGPAVPKTQNVAAEPNEPLPPTVVPPSADIPSPRVRSVSLREVPLVQFDIVRTHEGVRFVPVGTTTPAGSESISVGPGTNSAVAGVPAIESVPLAPAADSGTVEHSVLSPVAEGTRVQQGGAEKISISGEPKNSPAPAYGSAEKVLQPSVEADTISTPALNSVETQDKTFSSGVYTAPPAGDNPPAARSGVPERIGGIQPFSGVVDTEPVQDRLVNRVSTTPVAAERSIQEQFSGALPVSHQPEDQRQFVSRQPLPSGKATIEHKPDARSEAINTGVPPAMPLHSSSSEKGQAGNALPAMGAAERTNEVIADHVPVPSLYSKAAETLAAPGAAEQHNEVKLPEKPATVGIAQPVVRQQEERIDDQVASRPAGTDISPHASEKQETPFVLQLDATGSEAPATTVHTHTTTAVDTDSHSATRREPDEVRPEAKMQVNREKGLEKPVSSLITDEEIPVAPARMHTAGTPRPVAQPPASVEGDSSRQQPAVSAQPLSATGVEIPVEQPADPKLHTASGVQQRTTPAGTTEPFVRAASREFVIPDQLPKADTSPSSPIDSFPIDNTGTLIEAGTKEKQAVPDASADRAQAGSPTQIPEEPVAAIENPVVRQTAVPAAPEIPTGHTKISRGDAGARETAVPPETVPQERTAEAIAPPAVSDKAGEPVVRSAVPVREKATGESSLQSAVGSPVGTAPVQNEDIQEHTVQPENAVRTGRIIPLVDRPAEHPRTTAGRLTAQRMNGVEFAAPSAPGGAIPAMPAAMTDRGGQPQDNNSREQPFAQLQSLWNTTASGPEQQAESGSFSATGHRTTEVIQPARPDNEPLLPDARVVHLPFHGVRNTMPPVRIYRQVTPTDIPRTVQNAVRTFSGGSGGFVHMTLAPEALGELVVAISVKDRQTEVSIQAETPDARKMVEAQLPALKEKLAQAGLQVEHINVQTKPQDIVHGDSRSWRQGHTHDDQKSRQEFVRSFRHLAADEPREPAVVVPPRYRTGNGYFERYA